jgi:hypothetical protein
MQSDRRTWFLLLTVLLVVLLWIATPVFLIMPFKSQTPAMLAVSYFLRRWSPWVTVVGLGIALLLAWRTWRLGAGDAAAWPVNQLSYHHVVNTEVGGVPIAATY